MPRSSVQVASGPVYILLPPTQRDGSILRGQEDVSLCTQVRRRWRVQGPDKVRHKGAQVVPCTQQGCDPYPSERGRARGYRHSACARGPPGPEAHVRERHHPRQGHARDPRAGQGTADPRSLATARCRRRGCGQVYQGEPRGQGDLRRALHPRGGRFHPSESPVTATLVKRTD